MKVFGKDIPVKKLFFLCVYYCFAQYIPRVFGGRFLRYQICRFIFKSIGKNVNIEYRACFDSGIDICVGNNSGLGIKCVIPSDTIIGDNVMMGPNCYILGRNHSFDRTDIPMVNQGFSKKKQTIIEDDVWIGRNVIFTPGRHVKAHSIIAAGCILCKDFPEYSMIGGNPSKLIRIRTSE